MPDISMCANEECKFKTKCYRYRAVPDVVWQAYADFKPIDGKCVDFWEIVPANRLADYSKG